MPSLSADVSQNNDKSSIRNTGTNYPPPIQTDDGFIDEYENEHGSPIEHGEGTVQVTGKSKTTTGENDDHDDGSDDEEEESRHSKRGATFGKIKKINGETKNGSKPKQNNRGNSNSGAIRRGIKIKGNKKSSSDISTARGQRIQRNKFKGNPKEKNVKNGNTISKGNENVKVKEKPKGKGKEKRGLHDNKKSKENVKNTRKTQASQKRKGKNNEKKNKTQKMVNDIVALDTSQILDVVDENNKLQKESHAREGKFHD